MNLTDMDHPVGLKVQCRFCGTNYTIVVEQDDYAKYKLGEGLIQNIFPYLDADQRELLISGMCKVCWDNTFGK